jgi:hypothetical protein
MELVILREARYRIHVTYYISNADQIVLLVEGGLFQMLFKFFKPHSKFKRLRSPA